jgi:delta24-sterol reductase
MKKNKDNEKKRFLADFGVPFSTLEEFLQMIDQQLDVYPVWLLPFKIIPNKVKLFSPDAICDQAQFIIDVGVYGKPKRNFDQWLEINRNLEKFVHSPKIGGMKGFETVCYYNEEEFWKAFPKEKYLKLRDKYSGQVFPNLFEKVTTF